MLQSRGLDTSGLKADLVARLTAALESETEEAGASPTPPSSTAGGDNFGGSNAPGLGDTIGGFPPPPPLHAATQTIIEIQTGLAEVRPTHFHYPP